MNPEQSFSKLLGRQPTDKERARLYRVRDALGLQDNDALWLILMALESYDTLYREIPEKIAQQARDTLRDARKAFAAAAERESAKAQRLLAAQVAHTSVKIANRIAARPADIPWITTTMACVVFYGGVCMAAGYKLASTEPPFWATHGKAPQSWMRMGAMILGAPAGWMVFLLLMPAAVSGAKTGWMAATESMADGKEKLFGWTLVSLSAIGTVACLVMLWKMI